MVDVCRHYNQHHQFATPNQIHLSGRNDVNSQINFLGKKFEKKIYPLIEIIDGELIQSHLCQEYKDNAYEFNLFRKMYLISTNTVECYNPQYLREFNLSLSNDVNNSFEQAYYQFRISSNEMHNISKQICLCTIINISEFQSLELVNQINQQKMGKINIYLPESL